MAEHAHSTTRQSPPVTVITSRRIAVATALLALSGAAAARVAEPTAELPLKSEDVPDAELLAVAKEAMAGSELLHRHERHEISLTDQQVFAAIDAAFDGGEKLMKLHPRTPEGMKAKVAFVHAEFHRLVVSRVGETMESCGEYHERLAWSLISDVARRA